MWRGNKRILFQVFSIQKITDMLSSNPGGVPLSVVCLCLHGVVHHCHIPGRQKVGVSNERFSAKVKLRCIHTALLSPPVYLRRRVGLQCFQGVTKILNVLKISPRFRAVPLSLRYQGIGSSDTFSVFFHQIGMAGAGPKKI